MTDIKCEVKKSQLPGNQDGIYATRDIKKGENIVQYMGKIYKKRNTHRYNKTNDSNIVFFDGSILECFPDCLASKARDCAIIPDEPMNLNKVFASSEPLFKSFKDLPPNSSICLDDDNYKAYLRANRNIKKGDEIFVHNNFYYWLQKCRDDSYVILEDFRNFFERDCMKKYLKTFYPECVETRVDFDGKSPPVGTLLFSDNSGMRINFDFVNEVRSPY